MGNKQSLSHSETEPDQDQEVSRLPPSGRNQSSASARMRTEAGGAGEEADDQDVCEVPPPMQPISSMPAPDETSIKRVSCKKHENMEQYFRLT